ncbi:hypothetical protein UFOVP189_7 [uncultured Caudovirales phage]|uniref:Uncharacterized protein n=1 Tax=uncultured Caudovirales phage TaxID=2100421 RepID=A0A6J7WHX4_9CAUD|nr:hypothetical protein UFOVP189_7 [uncultured Caudovirales phage]
MAIKTGDLVIIKGTTMTGVVQGAAVDSDCTLLLLVSYTDTNGDSQERFFKTEELTT